MTTGGVAAHDAAAVGAQVAQLRVQLQRAANATESIAAHLHTLSTGTARAAEAVPKVAGEWQGPAARAAFGQLVSLRDDLERVAGATALAGTAARRHATGLVWASAALPDLEAGADPAAAQVALTRAQGIAAESATRCAATLRTLAGGAPPHRAGLQAAMHRVELWRASIALGATESLVGLGLTALLLSPVPGLTGPNLAGQLAETNPGELFDAVTDRKSWQSDPARAVGHLLPDLIAAAFSGGASGAASAATRTRTIVRLEAQAGAEAALRQKAQDVALATLKAEAGSARKQLVDEAADAADRRVLAQPGKAWRGDGELNLDPLENARVDVLYARMQAIEPQVTARLQQIEKQVDAHLVGLENRVKEAESLRRKVATWGGSVDALRGVNDILRYTFILPEGSYVAEAGQVAKLLSESGYHLEKAPSTWLGSGYKGVNSTWVDAGTGAKFEVQFHTRAGHLANLATHPWYERIRLPSTPPAEKALLQARSDAVYELIDRPPGVEVLGPKKTGPGLTVPKPQPEPVVPPVDTALSDAVLAGAAAGAATATTANAASTGADR
ncbi:hypothetical protein ACIB24_00965 [Spongisporangium articulatum]|uniref:Uncharacterized protein n=1 Tax=Spongisporangium articulatum TaxID=3362603 RepID=A0ABW8AH00_9ACTN